MPSYEFTGPEPRYYPEGRDASGRHLGNVEPGDIRILDDPPADGQWTPVIAPHSDGDEDRGGTGSDQDPAAEQHDETPPGPQPAAPAVIPQ